VRQPAIDAATGEEAASLQRGKIANKVLKNLGSVMVASIKEAKAKAAGEDASEFTAKIEEESKKMNKNAATDKADAGKALATVSHVHAEDYSPEVDDPL
jgi:Sec-independent protein translocase protein TatA